MFHSVFLVVSLFCSAICIKCKRSEQLQESVCFEKLCHYELNELVTVLYTYKCGYMGVALTVTFTLGTGAWVYMLNFPLSVHTQFAYNVCPGGLGGRGITLSGSMH